MIALYLYRDEDTRHSHKLFAGARLALDPDGARDRSWHSALKTRRADDVSLGDDQRDWAKANLRIEQGRRRRVAREPLMRQSVCCLVR